jgi:DNA-binding NtrC family response regulator
VLARLAELGRELGREQQLADLGLLTRRPPRRPADLERDGLVALASLGAGSASAEALLELLADSVAYGRAAVLMEGDDGLRAVAVRPAGACPEALPMAARALATGRCQVDGLSMAAPGPGRVVWSWRADRPFVAAERAFLEALARLVEPSVESREHGPAERERATLFVGASPQLRQSLALLERLAAHPVPVFVAGESGTGKELAARELHRLSGRGGAFVACNCAAIPESLFESELFGHVKGAFSGAGADREGLFEAADRGTLFLDEVADLPPAAQAKLLRVLDAGEVRPLGRDRSRRVDVRVVSATNRSLSEEVASGRFRADLYYRLVQVQLDLPPLRERTGDLLLLLRHFARRAARQLGLEAPRFTPEVIARLEAHRWPGNVRELEGLVRSLAIIAAGRQVRLKDLPPGLGGLVGSAAGDLRTARQASDREAIRRALEQTGGNRTEAARLLGIARQTLTKRIKALGLTGEV